MTPADFDAWLKHMGLSERRAAKLLGLAPATVGSYRRGVAHGSHRPAAPTRVVGLACAALAAGIEEWRPPNR